MAFRIGSSSGAGRRDFLSAQSVNGGVMGLRLWGHQQEGFKSPLCPHPEYQSQDSQNVGALEGLQMTKLEHSKLTHQDRLEGLRGSYVLTMVLDVTGWRPLSETALFLRMRIPSPEPAFVQQEAGSSTLLCESWVRTWLPSMPSCSTGFSWLPLVEPLATPPQPPHTCTQYLDH